MKTIFKFWLLAIMGIVMAVSFTACGDDDSSPSSPALVGKWEATGYKVNGIQGATIRLEFKSTGKGSITAVYPDGTDPDTYGFEYTSKFDNDGDMVLRFVFTGTSSLVYQSGTSYYPTVTSNRLILDGIEYVRK